MFTKKYNIIMILTILTFIGCLSYIYVIGFTQTKLVFQEKVYSVELLPVYPEIRSRLDVTEDKSEDMENIVRPLSPPIIAQSPPDNVKQHEIDSQFRGLVNEYDYILDKYNNIKEDCSRQISMLNTKYSELEKQLFRQEQQIEHSAKGYYLIMFLVGCMTICFIIVVLSKRGGSFKFQDKIGNKIEIDCNGDE